MGRQDVQADARARPRIDFISRHRISLSVIKIQKWRREKEQKAAAAAATNDDVRSPPQPARATTVLRARATSLIYTKK